MKMWSEKNFHYAYGSRIHIARVYFYASLSKLCLKLVYVAAHRLLAETSESAYIWRGSLTKKLLEQKLICPRTTPWCSKKTIPGSYAAFSCVAPPPPLISRGIMSESLQQWSLHWNASNTLPKAAKWPYKIPCFKTWDIRSPALSAPELKLLPGPWMRDPWVFLLLPSWFSTQSRCRRQHKQVGGNFPVSQGQPTKQQTLFLPQYAYKPF